MSRLVKWLTSLLLASSFCSPAAAISGDAGVRTGTGPNVVAPSGQVAPSPREKELEQRLITDQLEALKTQNKIIESYHDSILDNIYFALGGIFSLTVILLGYSWWFNTRAYENDKKALREGLENKLAASEDRISRREQEQRTHSETSVNSRIDSLASTTSATQNQMRTEFSEYRNSLSERMDSDAAKTDWLFREFRMIEDLVWSSRGSKPNAILSLAQALNLCDGDEDDDMFDIVARRLQDRINEMVGDSKHIGEGMFAQIQRRIEACSEKRPQKAGSILAALERIPREPDA